MDIQMYAKPVQPVNLPNAVVYRTPTAAYVDEDYSVNPPKDGTIEEIIKALKVSGPIIASGPFGVDSFATPIVLKKIKSATKEFLDGQKVLNPDLAQKNMIL